MGTQFIDVQHKDEHFSERPLAARELERLCYPALSGALLHL